MKHLLSLVLFLITTLSLMAQNSIITYTATQKLPETTDVNSPGLHTNAFGYYANIISHTFADNVGTITFDDVVNQLGYRAFYDCDKLLSVDLDGCSIDTIGKEAFADCTGLTSITIPNFVTSIGEWAFYRCSGLTSIDIPNSVTSIRDYAFLYCTGLTSITIPSSVTSIGECAFSGCFGLTSITIPNFVTSIGNYAFSGCSSLTSITIPNSVTSIGEYAFSGCSSLTSITIPSSVTSIGNDAFCDCSSLTSIDIPNSVTNIRDYAFAACTGLTSITSLPLTPPELGQEVFDFVPRDIPLYVHESAVPAYQAAAQWNEFDIQPLLVDVNPVSQDTMQLTWLPVDSAAMYQLHIYSDQISLDTTLCIAADSLNGGIRYTVSPAPKRINRVILDDISTTVVITIDPLSGMSASSPFVVTVSTKSKEKININYDLQVLSGSEVISQEEGSFTLNQPLPAAEAIDNVLWLNSATPSSCFDLNGRSYPLSQWSSLPAGIYVLRNGEKVNRFYKR